MMKSTANFVMHFCQLLEMILNRLYYEQAYVNFNFNRMHSFEFLLVFSVLKRLVSFVSLPVKKYPYVEKNKLLNTKNVIFRLQLI